MKKLFIFAVAAMAMTACSNQEDVIDNVAAQREIGFSGLNSNISRSTPDPNNGEAFDEDNVMYVSANYKGTGATDTYAAYFTGKTFKHESTQKGGKDWWGNFVDNTPTPIYYPMEGYMNFMAYTTDTEHTKTWNQLSNQCTVTWTDLDGYDDVMYSNLISDVQCSKTTDVQSFRFYHALAWINYKVKANVDGAVKVYGITMNQPSLNGTATFTFAATPSVSWDNVPASTANVAITGSTITVNSTGLQTWGNGLLVPDQKEKSFTIEYTITNDGAESAHMFYTYVPTAGAEADWVHGKMYTYNIIISLNEIAVNATVEPFTYGNTANGVDINM